MLALHDEYNFDKDALLLVVLQIGEGVPLFGQSTSLKVKKLPLWFGRFVSKRITVIGPKTFKFY